MPDKPFTCYIPQIVRNSNDDCAQLVADITVEAVAGYASDGHFKGVDIDHLHWKGGDVTMYIYECQPDTWDAIRAAANAYYLENLCPPQSKSIS